MQLSPIQRSSSCMTDGHKKCLAKELILRCIDSTTRRVRNVESHEVENWLFSMPSRLDNRDNYDNNDDGDGYADNDTHLNMTNEQKNWEAVVKMYLHIFPPVAHRICHELKSNE